MFSAGAGSQSLSAFEKILNKDNTKLNRIQTQARNFLNTGSYNSNKPRVQSAGVSRLSSAKSQKSVGSELSGVGGGTTTTAAGNAVDKNAIRFRRLNSAKQRTRQLGAGVGSAAAATAGRQSAEGGLK